MRVFLLYILIIQNMYRMSQTKGVLLRGCINFVCIVSINAKLSNVCSPLSVYGHKNL